MINSLKMLDRVIPFWEIAVFVLAFGLIILSLLFWWAFGYNLEPVLLESTPVV